MLVEIFSVREHEMGKQKKPTTPIGFSRKSLRKKEKKEIKRKGKKAKR